MRRTPDRLLLLSLLAALCLPASRAQAGAWSPAPGAGYAKIWFKYLPGFNWADGNGDTVEYGSYHEAFFNAYGEIGLAPRLAIAGHMPVLKLFSLETPRDGKSTRTLTLGEPTVTLRYQWLSVGRLAGSVEAMTTVNMTALRWTDNETTQFQDVDGNAVGQLTVGADTWDVGGALSLGYGWDRMYLSAMGGYLARTNEYDDVAQFTAEVGGNLRGKWHGRFRLIGYYSIANGNPNRRHNSPSGIGSGTSYTGFALELEYEIVEGQRIGLTSEGGMLLTRQTGGPVTTLYWATGWQ